MKPFLILVVILIVVACKKSENSLKSDRLSLANENTPPLNQEEWEPSTPIIVFSPEDFDLNKTSHEFIERKIRMAIFRANNRKIDVGKLTKEDFEQVRELEVPYGIGNDVTPLTGLKRLEVLRLQNNKISNIEPLSSLTSLKKINLNNNAVTNLAPLTRLKRLEFLYLDENPIEDLTPLGKIQSLKGIQLNFCPNIKRSEINTLRKTLPNVQILAWE